MTSNARWANQQDPTTAIPWADTQITPDDLAPIPDPFAGIDIKALAANVADANVVPSNVVLGDN